MAIHDDLETPLAEACRRIGGQSALGRLIDRDQSTVHEWLRDAKPLPAEHVLAVEAATGVSRHELRPDIYPEPTPPPAAVEQRAAGGMASALEGVRS